jgi:RimJ/RimL family protein N-acetyltransferase
MTPRITFRPLARADRTRLRDWLNQPHVYAWWGVPSGVPDSIGGPGADAATLEQVDAEYRDSFDGTGTDHRCVIEADGQPVGMIQWYRLSDEPEYAAAIGEPHGAGMDLLLGDPDRIGRGLGPRVIDAFVTGIVFAEPGVERCVAGPDVRNVRSVRAFARAGFSWARDALVAGEPAPERIMVRDRGDEPRRG